MTVLIPGTILQRGGEKRIKKMGTVKWNKKTKAKKRDN